MRIKYLALFPLLCMCATSCSGGASMINKELDNIQTSDFMYFPDIKMEVNQRLCIDNYIIEHENSEVLIYDSSLVKLEDNCLIGLKEGLTYLLLKANDSYQKVEIDVKPIGTYKRAWNISSMQKGEKIVAFGDSVTANATINADLTYVRKIAKEYGLTFKNNYAIGGTTGTYMYEGSNIWKEYKTLTDVLDGPRRVKQAVDNGEIDDVDYAFIAYGHNDQYFQPPITVEGDDIYNVDNFDNAHSFKGSYRFMVNCLRKANPNIKIILLNCTYSEYCLDSGRTWGSTYLYKDYRQAITELAEELDCLTIDPWNHMKQYFDANDRNVNYKDVVHLTVKGHEKLANYIKKF